MCFQDHKGCALCLLAHLVLLETTFPSPLHSVLLKLHHHQHIAMTFQGDTRVFAKHVRSEVVRPNYQTWLWGIAVWANNWVICARGWIGTLCCSSKGELNKIGAWAFLHVNGDMPCLPFCFFKNNLAEWRWPKTQPTQFWEAPDWGVVKYMGTDVLHNMLSVIWIES